MSTRPLARSAAIAALAIALGASLPGCGGKDDKPTAPKVTADVTIDILGNLGANSYSPNPDTLTSGQTVSWRNMDSIAHTATQDAMAFGTGVINPGETSLPFAITATGTYTYHCQIHGFTMAGTLVVVP